MFQLDQTPVTGSNTITNAATANPSFWGSLTGSGAMPALVAGARAYTGNAWQFNGGYKLAEGPDAITKTLGDANNTAGITVAFWIKYLNTINDNWVRVCGLGGSGESFDASIQNATAGAGQGKILMTFGFNNASHLALIQLQTPSPVLDGNWHHLVMAIDFRKTTNNALLYVDNVKKVTLSATVSGAYVVTNAPLYIGARGNGSAWTGGALDQFMVFTNALTATEISEIYNSGIVTNYAPRVMISPPAATLLWTNGATNVSVNLSANIVDDGLPNPPGLVTNGWTVTSGPYAVAFASKTNSGTTATFTNQGTYVLRCTAGDGQFTDYDETTVMITSNSAPVIRVASASQSLILNTNPTTINLSAFVTDDGLPSLPGFTTNLWSQLSGPGTVTFGNATNLNTTATFPTNLGTYVLQLYTSDSMAAATTNLTVTVTSNLPPGISIAVDAPTLNVPTNWTTLRATITDDGRPNPPGKTTNLWSQISGPSTAIFGSPTNATTTVSNLLVGQYIFQIIAADGQLYNTNTTWVNVWSPGRPLVLAGSTRTLWLPNALLTLNGSYTNTTGAVSLGWSLAQGPGNASFGSPNALTTTATFTNAGVFVVSLSVTNGVYINRDSLVVQVWPASSNFNYAASQLYNFTNDENIAYDFTGLNWNAIKPPPPPYAHPRLLFNPEDLPGLRARLTATTSVGPVLMNTIRVMLTNQLYSASGQFYTAYNELSVGITTTFDSLPNPDFLVGVLSYECFRCLIDNDAAGGAKAGAALATIADEAYAEIAALHSSDWRNVNSLLIHYQFMAYAYDFDYNFMTPEAQAAVRRALALATADQWSIGMDALPAPEANTSNWINNNGLYLLLNALAIEGETGYDTNCLPRLEACYDRFFSIDCFADGALYEGMGKGSIYGETLIVLGKRGILTGATTAAKNYIRQLFLQSMETTGFGFTWDELVGNSFGRSKYADTPALKWLYPDDPIIDFMQRNDYGQTDYLASAPVTGINLTFVYDVTETLVRAMLAQDFNTNLNFPQALAMQVATNAPLTCLFNERGLLITRSDWTTNTLRLFFQPRCVAGGHAEPDRNAFDISALGRIWVPQLNGFADPLDMSAISSVLRIDGKGPNIVPAAVVDFADTPNFTYAAGDAHDSYSYNLTATTTVGNGGLINYTYNQKLFQTNALPWFNMPWGQLPNWYDSTATNPVNARNPSRYWTNWVPVLKAFRTAGVVRGSTPYALIVDDIRKDNSPHAYDWRMMLADDLTNANFAVNGNDCVITPAGGTAKFLVRVLGSASTPVFATNSIVGELMLDISETNVAPDFKILLLPYTNAAPPAVTTWSNNVLTVAMADGQTDRIYCNTNADGRTRLQAFRIAGVGAVPTVPSLAATAGVAQVTLNWTASAGATGYNLGVSTTNGGPYAMVVTNFPGTNFTQTNLLSGTNYYYVVSALNPNGPSENSMQVGIAPLAASSAPPVIGGIQIIGGNLIITGTNGTGTGNYLVLTATNLTLPLSNWTILLTNQYGPSGSVNFTSPWDPVSP
ncbi:MAG: LamG-like jellyroll fold domain-containing protein, partial [Verrucomicrobiota bacterium]